MPIPRLKVRIPLPRPEGAFVRFLGIVIFVLILSVVLAVSADNAYHRGFKDGAAKPKVCASVPGEIVVSTTDEICTYANAYGRAIRKRRAI